MAACTQRAGTITPVKSSVVTGRAVGLRGGTIGDAGSVGEGVAGREAGGVMEGDGVGETTGSASIPVAEVSTGVSSCGWQAAKSSEVNKTRQAKRRMAWFRK
jgi:hypothetical protein